MKEEGLLKLKNRINRSDSGRKFLKIIKGSYFQTIAMFRNRY
ncbi:MAG: hypothetical protein ACJA1H_001670 [Glaciecola sp.]|jgi:hypothetical protein